MKHIFVMMVMALCFGIISFCIMRGKYTVCEVCEGYGTINCVICDGKWIDDDSGEKCGQCFGGVYQCGACDGDGKLTEDEIRANQFWSVVE